AQWVAPKTAVTTQQQGVSRVRIRQQVTCGGGIEEPTRTLRQVVLRLGTQALAPNPAAGVLPFDGGCRDQGLVAGSKPRLILPA
ncbi:MAG: hypothetical protein IIZ92_22350, partial [Aquincola sp.]|nr:hypothetical protein [Aquincola sp.]